MCERKDPGWEASASRMELGFDPQKQTGTPRAGLLLMS